MRARTAVAISVTALGLLSACSAATEGQARPTGAAASAPDRPDGNLPHSGAPGVANPLDATKLEQAQRDPCSTLTAAQVMRLGLSQPGTKKDNQAGPSCRWSDTEAGSSVQMYFPTKVIYQGLSQLYESHKRYGGDDYFFAMPAVQGFPLLASATADSRDLGSCSVKVGLTDRQVVYVQLTTSYEKRGQLEPCATAREVAGMALTTMKGGG